MKKLELFLIALLSITLVTCGSSSKETVKDSTSGTNNSTVDDNAPMVSAGSSKDDKWVKKSNEKLAKIPVKGFKYKESEVPAQKWDVWAKVSAPVIKKIINKLPAGYVLQVTGHTDARGPEEPVGDKPGNIKLSTDRAQEVHAALRRQGITSEKMTYKGVGSSQLKKNKKPESAKQRRVTFVIVPE